VAGAGAGRPVNRPVQVTENVFFASGTAVNWVLLRDGSDLTLIDGGYPGDLAAVEATIRHAGGRPEDVRAILVTHAHVDHLGAVNPFHRRYGTPVYLDPAEVPHARREYLEQLSPVRLAANLWRPGVLPWAARIIRAGATKNVAAPHAQPFPAPGGVDAPGEAGASAGAGAPGEADASGAVDLPGGAGAPAGAGTPGVVDASGAADLPGGAGASRTADMPESPSVPESASVALDLPGDPVPVPTYGHTSGHTAYFLPAAGIIVTGDALITGHAVVPTTGPQLCPAFFTHDQEQARQALGSLAALDANVILPGHGPVHRGPVREAVAAALRTG
jgi:glyoxylase-like metal-dependent hydrolase (beta-lactamase superfamily II)